MTLDEIIFAMLCAAAALSVQVGLAEALRYVMAFMFGLAQGLAS